jgi:hypothetical protein
VADFQTSGHTEKNERVIMLRLLTHEAVPTAGGTNMSAFICTEDHFKALAIFAASRTIGYGTSHRRVDPNYIDGMPPDLAVALDKDVATTFANILYRENIRSVGTRYPADKLQDMPGPNNKPDEITIESIDFTLAVFRLPPLWILKMCDCLEYQSCENDDYRQTVAFELLDKIRRAAIKALKGYGDAPWEYSVNDETLTRPTA